MTRSEESEPLPGAPVPEWGSKKATREWDGPGRGKTVKVSVAQATKNAERLLAESMYDDARDRGAAVKRFGAGAVVFEPRSYEPAACVARHNLALARRGKTGPLSGIENLDQFHALERGISVVLETLGAGRRWDRDAKASDYRKIRWRFPRVYKGGLRSVYRDVARTPENAETYALIDRMYAEGLPEIETTWARSAKQAEALQVMLGDRYEWAPTDLVSAGIDNSAKLRAAALEYRRLCDPPHYPDGEGDLKQYRHLTEILRHGLSPSSGKPLTKRQRSSYESRAHKALDRYRAGMLEIERGTGIPPARVRKHVAREAADRSNRGPLHILPPDWHPGWGRPVPRPQDFPPIEMLEKIGREHWREILHSDGGWSRVQYRFPRTEEEAARYTRFRQEKRPKDPMEWWDRSVAPGFSMANFAWHTLMEAALDERERHQGPFPEVSRRPLGAKQLEKMGGKPAGFVGRKIYLSDPFEVRPGTEARYLKSEEAPAEYTGGYPSYLAGIVFREGEAPWDLSITKLLMEAKPKSNVKDVFVHDYLVRMDVPESLRLRNRGRSTAARKRRLLQ